MEIEEFLKSKEWEETKEEISKNAFEKIAGTIFIFLNGLSDEEMVNHVRSVTEKRFKNK